MIEKHSKTFTAALPPTVLTQPPSDERGGGKKTAMLELPEGAVVEVCDDRGSDRLRCDHPETEDGASLGELLVETARARGRGRVVLMAPSALSDGLEAAGLRVEAELPGFYGGQEDGAVYGKALDPTRGELANPVEVARVEALLDAIEVDEARPDVVTERAARGDAPALSALLAETFPTYPTPSHDPAYVAEMIARGVPFRMVREGARLVACASADLVPEARTAELTDCATRPDQRGRGLMRALLSDLMDDLRALDYPTAFTLARARIPGINIVFRRLGFVHRGLMTSSCQIGGGLEDMAVWSRAL